MRVVGARRLGARQGPSGRGRQWIAGDPARLHVGLMQTLTFATGITDAVGFLGLDRVFTGNMTGNVVILGMGLAGADELPVLGPALALVGFMAGAAGAGRAMRHDQAGWGRTTGWLFGLVGITLIAVGGALLVTPEPSKALTVWSTTILAAAMGVQAAGARHLAVKDVTTVVVTSTITALAADSRLGAAKAAGGGPRRALAIAAILLGALVGALLLMLGLGWGLLLAGFITLTVCAIGIANSRAISRI